MNERNKKRKEKFADLLLDIVKYIITAGLLAFWFSDLSQWEWYSYVILTVGILLALTIGFLLYGNDEKSKQSNI